MFTIRSCSTNVYLQMMMLLVTYIIIMVICWLDFWATWCGPCKKIAPDIEALAKEYEGQVVVGKIDVEEAEELATQFGVRNIPTIVFIKNGEIVDKVVGAAPKSTFEEKL